MAHTESTLQLTVDKFAEASRLFGLTISLGKTEVLFQPGPLATDHRPLLNKKGRDKKGSIFVFAAGNGGTIAKDSCAYNGYVNSIYTIAITGLDRAGSVPSYGEVCPGIMAAAYSRNTDEQKTSERETVHTSMSSKCGDIRPLEHVQVRVSLEVWLREDLLLTLESPSKTIFCLTQHGPIDRFWGYSNNLTDRTILTLHHCGENPQGFWKLKAELGSRGKRTSSIIFSSQIVN
ncbi:Kexin [Stylophora pistillata]|uniref:Kexin n=1 Tax=Stylophora pistillata TaxID=50429 RepID=A0A2B4RCS1_STYPI|nr:Kexin [Stylophora pistillata]